MTLIRRLCFLASFILIGSMSLLSKQGRAASKEVLYLAGTVAPALSVDHLWHNQNEKRYLQLTPQSNLGSGYKLYLEGKEITIHEQMLSYEWLIMQLKEQNKQQKKALTVMVVVN